MTSWTRDLSVVALGPHGDCFLGTTHDHRSDFYIWRIVPVALREGKYRTLCEFVSNTDSVHPVTTQLMSPFGRLTRPRT